MTHKEFHKLQFGGYNKKDARELRPLLKKLLEQELFDILWGDDRINSLIDGVKVQVKYPKG